MNKYFVFLILFMTTSVVQSACSNKINPGKIVLFIDTNFSDMEISHAENAACKRGERFEVVPKDYKEYSGYIKEIQLAKSLLDSCNKSQRNVCKKEYEKSRLARKKFDEFQKKQIPFDQELKRSLQEIKDKKAQITSIVISGHDGGGGFHGEKGSIDRQTIGQLIHQFPEINDVTSLLLLGCYTGVQQEVANWTSIFPNVSLIAGYDGSAPDFSRPQGHQYIEDILIKEKDLTGIKNSKQINDKVRKQHRL